MARLEFETYYEKLWSSRWPDLYASLMQPSQKVALLNPFVEKNRTNELCWNETAEAPSEAEGLLSHYNLDLASIYVVKAMQPEPGQLHLDLCAAPGGKSLASVFSVNGDGEWTLNDASAARASRLRRVVKEHVPESVQANIYIHQKEGAKWGLYNKDKYDRVLVDAPCSGERHILETKSELDKWSPSRTKKLKVRQVSLACAGFDSLKPGGRMVYSTCSISQLENDDVIKTLLKKRKGSVAIVDLPDDFPGEDTELGKIFLPDKFNGFGPMYLSVITKK